MTHEAKLSDAIAKTARIAAHLRNQAMQHNQPEWHGDILALVDLAEAYHAAHTPEYRIDTVADHYDLLLGKAREIRFPDDEDFQPEGRAAALFGAVGQLIGAADEVKRAAAALGKLPTSAAQPLPEKIEIERTAYQREINALISHVREVRDMVRERVAPEAAAPDHGALEQAIIGNYVKDMQLTDKSINVTISIGDGIDLAVLERFVSRLATATGEMIDSVKSWPGAAATRLRIGIEAVRKPVRRAVGSVGGLILKLVRAAPKQVPPPEPSAPAPPLPRNYLAQAREMIPRGETPPAHWRPKITKLDFILINFTDLTPLAQLTALKSLILFNTSVSDLTPLAQLTALKNLNLFNAEVSDSNPLSQLTALESLDLTGTKVSDLTPLAHLTALKSLKLGSTKVSDLTPLTQMTALKTLNLWDTRVTDLTPLAHLATLKTLILRSIKISDIAALAQLTALESLDLTGTKVSDLTPLAHLTALKSLKLGSTKVGNINVLSAISGLKVMVSSGRQVRALRATLAAGSRVTVEKY